MFSIEIECAAARREMLVAELWDEGSAGIVETAEGLRAFFEDGADRQALMDRYSAATWRQEEARDWVAEARAGWEPMAIGERFFLVPEWRDDPAPAGRFRMVVNPGMAFGTGKHETTQLCLEALERYVSPGSRLLDVGTGTGILAQAGGLLGAVPVWACDVDPDAVEVARGKLEAVFTGSADAVRRGVADVITANISPETITLLAADLLGCLRAGGVALLSGLERHDVAGVEAALARHGGAVQDIRYKGEWALLAVGGTLIRGVSDVRE